MQNEPHIIFVDDHKDLRDLGGEYLSQHGYRTSLAENGAALFGTLDADPADLIVLDIMMPGEDGIAICRQVRAAGLTPILFLTAMADEADRIVGLELGADDYLTKPFNPRELLARIRAVLRRTSAAASSSSDTPTLGKSVRFGGWRVDMSRRELVGEDGVAVALSTAEFRLLKVFLERPGSVLDRDQLLDMTVGRRADPFDRSIDNQVSRLRKKIEIDPRSPSIIITHWGGGYSMAVDVRS